MTELVVKFDSKQLEAAVQAALVERLLPALERVRERIDELEHRHNQVLALCANSDETGRLIDPGQIRDILEGDQT